LYTYISISFLYDIGPLPAPIGVYKIRSSMTNAIQTVNYLSLFFIITPLGFCYFRCYIFNGMSAFSHL